MNFVCEYRCKISEGVGSLSAQRIDILQKCLKAVALISMVIVCSLACTRNNPLLDETRALCGERLDSQNGRSVVIAFAKNDGKRSSPALRVELHALEGGMTEAAANSGCVFYPHGLCKVGSVSNS